MRYYHFNPNPKDTTLVCPNCGTEFKPQSRNAKYCCDTCRYQDFRKKKKQEVH